MKVSDLNIKALRKSKNLSQQELSDITGIMKHHISRIETGKVNQMLMSIEKTESILNALGFQLEVKPIEPEKTNWKKLL